MQKIGVFGPEHRRARHSRLFLLRIKSITGGSLAGAGSITRTTNTVPTLDAVRAKSNIMTHPISITVHHYPPHTYTQTQPLKPRQFYKSFLANLSKAQQNAALPKGEKKHGHTPQAGPSTLEALSCVRGCRLRVRRRPNRKQIKQIFRAQNSPTVRNRYRS